MIVPDRCYEPEETITAVGDAPALVGYVSGVDASVKDDRRREPIGFRMPAREPPIDPSWMLL